jgi:hypothetical protein
MYPESVTLGGLCPSLVKGEKGQGKNGREKERFVRRSLPSILERKSRESSMDWSELYP